MMLILAGTFAVLLILSHHGGMALFSASLEADLIFVAAFWVCAYDLVSLSLWLRDLHPTTAHGAMVGDYLWPLLGHLLDVLQIA
jgi:hypothetical protein